MQYLIIDLDISRKNEIIYISLVDKLILKKKLILVLIL
jgi:hypothetical protein